MQSRPSGRVHCQHRQPTWLPTGAYLDVEAGVKVAVCDSPGRREHASRLVSQARDDGSPDCRLLHIVGHKELVHCGCELLPCYLLKGPPGMRNTQSIVLFNQIPLDT